VPAATVSEGGLSPGRTFGPVVGTVGAADGTGDVDVALTGGGGALVCGGGSDDREQAAHNTVSTAAYARIERTRTACSKPLLLATTATEPVDREPEVVIAEAAAWYPATSVAEIN
jgi:hypothetical protein